MKGTCHKPIQNSCQYYKFIHKVLDKRIKIIHYIDVARIVVNTMTVLYICSVHIKLEEKLNLTAGRDGGLESMELTGMLMLRISDEHFGKVKLQLETPSKSAIQIQPHPNIDKELLRARSQIAMKNPAKPFPTNTDVGVLKWRFQTNDDSQIPLSSKQIVF